MDIKKEIYECYLFYKIQNYFINKVYLTFGDKLFSLKKNFRRNIANNFSSWIMLNSSYNYNKNILLPDKIYFQNLKIFLTNYLKQNRYINKYDLIYLVDCFFDEIKLKEYILNQKKLFLKPPDFNFKIKKNLQLNQIYFNIETNYSFPKKFFYKINNIKISHLLYYKIKNQAINNIDLDNKIYLLLIKYNLLSSNNHQLAVNQEILTKLNNYYQVNYECFASPFNNFFKNYNSLFSDIEKDFGSKGNFFDQVFIEGVYLVNPPFENLIIEKTIHRLINFLNRSDFKQKNLTFFITLPVWDNIGKSILNEKSIVEYEEFNIINVIKSSPYLKYIKMINKNKFSYYDYNHQKKKNKTIQHTYLIVLTNTLFDTSYLDKISYF